MKESTRRDDIRNLSLVWGAGITAGILTLAMLLRGEEPQPVEVVISADPVPVVVEIPQVQEPAPEPVVVQRVVDSGSNRLFGTVVTVRGREYEGFIRWDKNEGSWADLLDANKSGGAEYGRLVRAKRAPRAMVVRMDRDRARMQRELAAVAREQASQQREVAQHERDAAQMERDMAQMERDVAQMERDIEREAAQMEREIEREAAQLERELERAFERSERDGNREDARKLGQELRERIRNEFDFQFDIDTDVHADADDDDSHFFVVGGSGSNVSVVTVPEVSVSVVTAPMVRIRGLTSVATRGWTMSSSSQSGIRFGHVESIQALDSHSALFTLKSGEQMELSSNATDLGTSMRALIIEQLDGRVVELGWSDLDVVHFRPAPEDALSESIRMYGTMMTRSGAEFTGYVTWDVDEVYSTDVLDGEDRGRDMEIPFGDIESIERYSSRSAFVTLQNGDEVVLEGEDDVNSSNGGISVSDPMLGQVKVRWDEFESVRFHEAETHAGYSSFDGGKALFGTVITGDGEEHTGNLVWDRDEAFTWEMLNGSQDGVEFHVEFSNIANIEHMRSEVRVTLKDGRTFELGGNNDVDNSNRGIVVQSDGNAATLIDWDDVREVRFQER